MIAVMLVDKMELRVIIINNFQHYAQLNQE